MKKFSHPFHWIPYLSLTFLGTGLAPKAPGTFGTLGAMALYLLLYTLNAATIPVFLFIVFISTLLCILFGNWMVTYFEEDDPPSVVLDEVAGYFTSLVILVPHSPLITAALAFLFFRFFDILKPPPVSWLEKLPKGYGVALDDVAAGILASLLLNLIFYIF
ncbi:MAG: phosphatidylglycerophosphatase A [Planctomycetota bacterium]|nr:MAG: phosphatidylglycerophosphatase A [Planctomycetota bacterium]